MLNLKELWNRIFGITKKVFSYRYEPFIRKFEERQGKIKVDLNEWLDKNKLK